MAKIAGYLAVLFAVAAIAEVTAQADRRLCLSNQVWSDCPTSCPATCDNPNPVKCNKRCQPAGCICKPGYVLQADKCVRLQDCKRCPPNQVFSTCPTPCPATCDTPRPGPCIEVCKPSACVCQPGYVLKGNTCVRPQQCK